MPHPSFRRLHDTALIEVRVDGRLLAVPEGHPLAASLLVAGLDAWMRGLVSGAVHGPLCLMGSCMQCRATVNGRTGQRLCRTAARHGMVIETEAGGDV